MRNTREPFMLAATALALLLCALFVLFGCEGKTGPQGPAGPAGEVSNATCLNSSCHGKADLAKTIVNDQGVSEIIPLYVDEAKFTQTVHGQQKCVSCHTDIDASGGAHGIVFKTYGGWARFGRKQAVESISPNEVPRTRNYYTAASVSCVTCHSDHKDYLTSAHYTIYKLRSATVENIGGHMVGENYEPGNCNRCHASCATCHFKSTITRLDQNGSPLDYWDELQQNYPNVPGYTNAMCEFEMDWTTNVESHEFRKADYFSNDVEGVCEACHTGYYKPTAMAYYENSQGAVDSVRAANVKRHPQTYTLIISGDPSYATGDNNTVHAGKTCADCHGGLVGDVHSLPGLPYNWSTGGDVQCTDCHGSYVHKSGVVALHMDANGTKVACIGCHTFGMGRDFELATTGSSSAHDVFLDPVTQEVRPVAYKHGEAIAWYSHNWQTLNAGSGTGDRSSDCAKKCHYAGNVIGAPAW